MENWFEQIGSYYQEIDSVNPNEKSPEEISNFLHYWANWLATIINIIKDFFASLNINLGE